MALKSYQSAGCKKGNLRWILQSFMLSAISFYAGISIGIQLGRDQAADCWTKNDPRIVDYVKEKVNVKLRKYQKQSQQGAAFGDEAPRIPKETMGRVVTGMGRLGRDRFAAKFEMGVPLDQSVQGNNEILILYNHDDALPSNPYDAHAAKFSRQVPLFDSVDEATENCDNLHVILTDHSRRSQCLAIMGQYESYHIQKWMRLPEQGVGRGLNRAYPLRLVSRGTQENGRVASKLPTPKTTMQHFETLNNYIHSLPEILEQLRPMLRKIKNNSNAVIVMVCNFGQSELLMNFVCNSRAKGLDTSNVIVFCTDRETQVLAEHLQLTTFFNNWGGMPIEAAREFGDDDFGRMMAAKVYCVHLVSQLGYDVLFQDVDVIWYKNPLPWFCNSSSPYRDFDMIFQDDGNHALYYAPYSANTGFYFVRHSERTVYFLNCLLMAGDLIMSTHSHQHTLTTLLSEHASMYGLKIKVLERNTPEFPGGYSFHRKQEFMKDLLQGRIKAYIFHMSWTLNKENKIFYFQQMGEWFLREHCIGLPPSAIGGDGSGCCSREAIISCHYQDKPSKIPCRDSPPMDPGKTSFW
eukprot:scaffold4183_cov137-Cylindrotheca_fusiformis.AAC.15